VNLDPNQSFRHSRAGKQIAAIRDGVSTAQVDRSNEPTRPMTLEATAAQSTAALVRETVAALAAIRPQCAGDNFVTLEIPRTLLSQLQKANDALNGKKG
jgi:hypothetical protein